MIIKYLIGTNMDGSFHDNLMFRHWPEGTKENPRKNLGQVLPSGILHHVVL
jgi:hypothetical protein